MNILKKKFFLAVVLCMLLACVHAPRAHASTAVDANLEVDTEWTLAGSPYILGKDIMVPYGITLTIDPGVVVSRGDDFGVWYRNYYDGIDIEGGNLIANGTADQPITMNDFSVSVNSSVNGPGHAAISHAVVPGIYANRSSMTLDSDTMRFLNLYESTQVTATDVAVTGDSSVFTFIGSGSVLTMTGGSLGAVAVGYDAVQMRGGRAVLTGTEITSRGNGIYLYGYSTLVGTNLYIHNCGVAIKSQMYPSDVFDENYITLIHSEIAQNGEGLELSNKPHLSVSGNSIHDNSIGAVYFNHLFLADLKNNWWGDASGPYNTDSNTAGTGNPANLYVAFSPWLTTEPFVSHDESTTTTTTTTNTTSDTTSDTTTDDTSSTDSTTTTSTSTDSTEGQDSTETSVTETESTVMTNSDTEQVSRRSANILAVSSTPPPPSRTPVLIIPGVLGTEMSGSSGPLWLDLGHALTDIGDRFMDPLQFGKDLKPLDATVSFSDILRKKTASLLVKTVTTYDYSDSLIQQFESQGYVEGTDLFVFPYDWRSGVSDDAVASLKTKIADIKSKTGAGAVDIVAHSTGGLVVKKYVSENSANTGIRKVVFVGVPNIGAPKAVKMLVEGDDFGIPFLADSEMKKISQNMPAVYDLAPGAAYYADKGGYYQILRRGLTGTTIESLTPGETNSRLAANYGANVEAIAQAGDLHGAAFDGYDMRSAGIDVYAIDGCKTGTFGGIAEIRTSKDLGDVLLGYGALREIPGDGTVPLGSAATLPLDGAHTYYALAADHGRMMSQDGIRQEIVNILSGSALSVSNSLVTQDISQCKLNGHAISIYSPLSIDITDGAGNHAGLASDGTSIEDTIPNADYEIFGDHKFVYLPTDQGQTYSIQVAGIGMGVFTLTDSSIQDNTVTGMQVFSQIPVTPILKGSMALGAVPALALDTDGDGSVDKTLVPAQNLDAEDAMAYYPPAESEVPKAPKPVEAPVSAKVKPDDSQESSDIPSVDSRDSTPMTFLAKAEYNLSANAVKAMDENSHPYLIVFGISAILIFIVVKKNWKR